MRRKYLALTLVLAALVLTSCANFTSTTRAPAPANCCFTQPTETRTIPCPPGQNGIIVQQRISQCPGPTWGDWTTTSSSCMPPVMAPPPPPQVIEREVIKEVVVSLEPVYFDLDKSNIRPDAAATLDKDLQWFKRNPGKNVKIEGNCDERASVKYNIALGKRRARAVATYLEKAGIDRQLLHPTVTFGKNVPVCNKHDENCWQKNRRVDLVPVP